MWGKIGENSPKPPTYLVEVEGNFREEEMKQDEIRMYTHRGRS